MKNAIIAKTLVALSFVTLLTGTTLPAQADDKGFNDRIALAYAHETPQSDERFEQFELHGSYDDAHELNDAWLGMPVRDAAGEVVGYVEDAFLDDEGYLTELVVSLNGSGVSVYVDEKNVDYTDVAVLVDLPVRVIASLEQTEG